MSGPKGSSIDYAEIMRRERERAEAFAQEQQRCFNKFNALEKRVITFLNRYNALEASHNHHLSTSVEKDLKTLKRTLLNTTRDFSEFLNEAASLDAQLTSESNQLESEVKRIEKAAVVARKEIGDSLNRQSATISEFNKLIDDFSKETGLIKAPLVSVDRLIAQHSVVQPVINLAHLNNEVRKNKANEERAHTLLVEVKTRLENSRMTGANFVKLLNSLEERFTIINQENIESFQENELVINRGVTQKTLTETANKALEKLAIYLESKYRYSEALLVKKKINEFLNDTSLDVREKVSAINNAISIHCSADLNLEYSVERYRGAYNKYISLLAAYELLIEDLNLPDDLPTLPYNHEAINDSIAKLEGVVNTLLQQKAITDLLELYESRMAEHQYVRLAEKRYKDEVVTLYSFGKDTGLEITVTKENELHTKVVGFKDENGETDKLAVVAKMDEFCALRDEIHSLAAKKSIPVKDQYRYPSNVAYVEYVKRPESMKGAEQKGATTGRSAPKIRRPSTALARQLGTND